MRYLSTLLILIISEILYCTLLIGTDTHIIGQVNMTGDPVSQLDVIKLSTEMSLVCFPIFAAIYLFLHKKLIGLPKIAKTILPFLYIIFWLGVAASVAGFYEQCYGASWSGLEFSLFYLLTVKGLLLAVAIGFPFYLFNKWLLDRSVSKSLK